MCFLEPGSFLGLETGQGQRCVDVRADLVRFTHRSAGYRLLISGTHCLESSTLLTPSSARASVRLDDWSTKETSCPAQICFFPCPTHIPSVHILPHTGYPQYTHQQLYILA